MHAPRDTTEKETNERTDEEMRLFVRPYLRWSYSDRTVRGPL